MLNTLKTEVEFMKKVFNPAKLTAMEKAVASVVT